MLAVLKAKIEQYWHDLSGEARAELEKALADAKEAEAKLSGVVSTAKADLEAAIETAGPGVRAAVEAAVAKLVAEAEGLLGKL